MRITFRNLVFALLSILVVISGVWYLAEFRRAAQASDNLAAQQSSLVNAEAMVKRLREQLKQSNKGDQTVAIIPKSADQPGLFRELESAQAQTHVTIVSAAFTDSAAGQRGMPSGPDATPPNMPAPKAPTTAVTAPSVQVALQVNGSVANLLAFVHSLQSSQRVVVVKSFDLSLNGQQGTMSLTLNFPYQP